MSQFAEIALSRAVALVATAILVLLCRAGVTVDAWATVPASPVATAPRGTTDVPASALATPVAPVVGAASSASRPDAVVSAASSTPRPPAFMKKFEDDDTRQASQPAGVLLVAPARRAPARLACFEACPCSTTPIDAVAEAAVPPPRLRRVEGARAPPLA